MNKVRELVDSRFFLVYACEAVFFRADFFNKEAPMLEQKNSRRIIFCLRSGELP